MKIYIKSSESIDIKTQFHGNQKFSLAPTDEFVSFSYWGQQYDDLDVYEGQDGSLWVKLDDKWCKLKYTSQGLWIPSNVTALELDEWEAWNEKQNSNDWWR